MAGWWGTKVRQAFRHVTGRVTDAERAGLADWLTPPQMTLFEGMHRADQRHGLDVVAALRGAGHADPDLLLAGLLHDCSKGPGVRLRHRVGWALSSRWGQGFRAVSERLPGFEAAYRTIDEHAERSARLCLDAGCSEAAADLVRHQADVTDDPAERALRQADEAC